MKWSLTLILIGLLLVGCKSQTPVADPFFGRTTIPPPPTGSVTGRPGDPCYQAPPSVQLPGPTPSCTAPPLVQMPSQPPATSSTSQQYQPNISPPMYQSSVPPATSAPSTSPPGISPTYSAPRPMSTGPASTLAPRTAPAVPSTGSGAPSTLPSGSPYAPPGGYNYRGTSTQGSTPLVPTRPESRGSGPLFGSVAATSEALADPANAGRIPWEDVRGRLGR